MLYKQIKEECEQIKKIYGEDVSIDVKDSYYACAFKSKIGWFEFLINPGKIDKPHGLEFSLWLNDPKKDKDVKEVKDAILLLKGAEYEKRNDRN